MTDVVKRKKRKSNARIISEEILHITKSIGKISGMLVRLMFWKLTTLLLKTDNWLMTIMGVCYVFHPIINDLYYMLRCSKKGGQK